MDGDGEFELEGQKQVLDIFTDGVYDVTVLYEFVDKQITGEDIILTRAEKISIAAITKDIDACLTVSSENKYAPSIVTVNATCSRSRVGEIRTFEYDFGVGNGSVEGEGLKRFKYDEPGEYTISVTAISKDGIRDTASAVLVLKKQQEIGNMTISLPANRITAGKSATFSAEGSSGTVSEVVWDFGE